MGIDPITHKPFSQILADYGNIGGVSRSFDTPKYIGTIRRDLKKVTTTFSLPKPESSSSPSNTFLSDSQVSQNMSSMQNNYANYSNSSHSLDLLSQLQAISLVTEGPVSDTTLLLNNNNYDFFSLPSPKSSSNSSTSACSSITNYAGQETNASECFSWHEFLLEDAFKPAQNQAQEQETKLNDIGSGFSPMKSYNRNANQVASLPLSTSSDASSFLEAMLDQENDMFLSFPGLMEEPLY